MGIQFCFWQGGRPTNPARPVLHAAALKENNQKCVDACLCNRAAVWRLTFSGIYIYMYMYSFAYIIYIYDFPIYPTLTGRPWGITVPRPAAFWDGGGLGGASSVRPCGTQGFGVEIMIE